KLKTKVTNFQKRGLSQRDAYVFASPRKGYWRPAHSKTLSYSLTNRKLEQLGLMNMPKTPQSIQCD
ncbi:group II intron reverse transcriptase/maturase, partial [Lactobacillus reuteri]|nr:group II intron reverse transcriptase/maturase [Limosilactobacillus reuteri]